MRDDDATPMDISDIDGASWAHIEQPAPCRSPLLEKLVTDTQTAALLTAATTSLINVMRTPSEARAPLVMRLYQPRPVSIELSLRVMRRNTQFAFSADAALTGYFSSLEPALCQSEQYFKDVDLLGIERAVALHYWALASVWRPVCHRASEALCELSRDTRHKLPEFYGLTAAVLCRLLDAAAGGEAPCIDLSGHPYLPPLPQRRLAARRMLGQSAMLSVGGRTYSAYVRDISQGGIGLEHIDNLSEGQIGTVELATGRRFTGSIVWTGPGRAGLRFAMPLSPNDPLFWT